MHHYALAFLAGTLSSLGFIDSNVKKSVSTIGRISLVVFSLLFIASEAVTFFS